MSDPIEKLGAALIAARPLPAETEIALCADQKQPNIEKAVTEWLSGLLVLPDEDFALFLIPILSQRLDEYIDNIRSTSPWMQ